MKKQYLSIIFILSFFIGFIPVTFLWAESACDSGAKINPDDKVALQTAYNACLQEIAAQDALLKNTTAQKVGIQRDLTSLAAQINKALLSIKASDITIKGLQSDIINKTLTINELSDKIEREKQSVSQLLRKTNEIDQSSMVEVVLSQKNISDFFLDIDSFNSIKKSLQDSLNAISDAKALKEKEKGILTGKE